MRRNIEICRKCNKLEECQLPGEEVEYVCNALIFPIFSQMPWGVDDWNKMDVPQNCDFYAEHFVEECNN